jgi:hypothetical protein
MDLTPPEYRSPVNLSGIEAVMDVNLLAERFLFFYPADLVNAEANLIRAAMRNLQGADRHIRKAHKAQRELASPAEVASWDS